MKGDVDNDVSKKKSKLENKNIKTLTKIPTTKISISNKVFNPSNPKSEDQSNSKSLEKNSGKTKYVFAGKEGLISLIKRVF